MYGIHLVSFCCVQALIFSRLDVTYNSLLFIASELTSIERLIGSETRQLINVVIAAQKLMESIRARIIQIHFEFCCTYFMVDIEIVST